MELLQKLSLAGIIPAVKMDDAADAVPLCQALSEGGLPVAEISFRTAAAPEAIAAVHRELPEVLLGAGTITTTGQVDSAITAGAAYIVSPGINPEVVRHCQEAGIPIIPGCVTSSEIELALSLGIRTVKFFPAEAAGGLAMIQALSAPYGEVCFVPTGGISEQNLLAYLSWPQVAACGGSWMVPADAVRAKDWQRIRAVTGDAVQHMMGFELAHLGINADGENAAITIAGHLSALLGRQITIGNSSVFAGDEFEVMKGKGRGTHGHIGIRTHFLGRARAYLEKNGYRFVESTLKEKNGRPVAIFLEEEIGGFAIHLLQK